MMKLKVCGATRRETCEALDALGVAWIGLWHRMPRGRHDLDADGLDDALRGFSPDPARARPMLVTMAAEPEWLFPLCDRHGLSHVQLHGFQLPGAVARLKRGRPALAVFKTLHVQDGRCLEERFIDAYLDAGVEAFIVDSFVSRDAAGSTGRRFDPDVLGSLCGRYPAARWLCAGGLTAECLPQLARQFPDLDGVDIDSGARVAGQIDAGRVAQLLRGIGAARETRQ